MKQEEYLCCPERKGKRTALLCIGLLLASAVSFYLAFLFPLSRALGQLICVICLLLFVQLSSKYLLTRYRYTFREGSLFLSKMQGKRVKHLGSIPITSSCLLMKKEEWKKRKKEFSLSQRFSYCQNLSSPRLCALLCPHGEKYFLLFFEPDENLVCLLEKKIGESK